MYRSPTILGRLMFGHISDASIEIIYFEMWTKTLSCCLSTSHSLADRTFSTLEFYRKHQDNMTPAGLAFFQSQWDESVTKTFHNTLSESLNYIISGVSDIIMNNVSNVVLIVDPCRHEGASLWVHQASSLPPSTGQIPSQAAAALPGQIQKWKGTHIWNILIYIYHNK